MKKKTVRSSLARKARELEYSFTKFDDLVVAYEELTMIRSRIVENKMTDELYDFINHNHGLENLFNGLPKTSAVPESAMESIQCSQLRYVDIALENIFIDIKNTLVDIWNKFVEWLKDWFITNRRLRFRLQRHYRLLDTSMMKYGSPDQFAKAKGFIYKYDSEWKPMFKAAVKLRDIMDKIPQNEPAKFFVDNFKDLQSALGEFGWELSTTRGAIDTSHKKYITHEMELGGSAGNWTQNSLKQSVKDTIDLLATEETARGKCVAVKRAFDKTMAGDGDAKDVAALTRIVRIAKASKKFFGDVARGILDVCNIALRSA